MHFQVLAHGLDVADVVDVHLDDAVLGLEEERRGRGRGGRRTLDLRTLDAFAQALGGTLEVLQPEGLEQVVDGGHLEALDGVLGIGGGEDYQRCKGERLDKVHAVEVGHVDVAENGVDGVVLQEVARLDGTLALCRQLEVGHLADVGGQLSERQRLVVNG